MKKRWFMGLMTSIVLITLLVYLPIMAQRPLPYDGPSLTVPPPLEPRPKLSDLSENVQVYYKASPEERLGQLMGDPFCLSYYTGTIRSTFVISNPDGISGLEGYSLVNVDQRVVSQSATAVELEIAVQRYLDTLAQYPVNVDSLPQDVQEYLLPEDGWIQSDDPEIVAKASELASGLAFQVEVTEAILAWVRANVAFDYTSSLPYDALSTFHNRSALCGGFATLSVALMRAADIPARTRLGCLASEGWSVPIQGGWHAWVEIYYPDVGWVASDPQTTANFVDTSHIFGGFHQCGQEGTVISRTQHLTDPSDGSAGLLYSTRTSYIDAPWYGLDMAHVPSMGRDFQLRVTLNPESISLPVVNPIGMLAMQIEDLSCRSDTLWTIRTETSWLSPSLTMGIGSATVSVSINAAGMQPGAYIGTMSLYNTQSDLDRAARIAINVDLKITDPPEYPVAKVFLPIVLSESTALSGTK